MRNYSHLFGSSQCLGISLGSHGAAWATIGRWSDGRRAGASRKPGGGEAAVPPANSLSAPATDATDAQHLDSLAVEPTGECALATADEALPVLARVLQAHIAAHGPRSPIVIGIAPERTYIASVSDASEEELAVPATMLARRGFFRGGSIESLAVDVIGTDGGLTAVAACSRDWIKKITQICIDAGALVVRIEPTVVTLARGAHVAARASTPRPGVREHFIHLVATESSRLALWTRGAQLLACRSLHASADRSVEMDVSECHTAVRGLEIYGEQRLGSPQRPAIAVHGGATDGAVAAGLRAQLSSQSPADVRHIERPTIGARDLALLVARSARGPQRAQVDLGRAFWPPAALFELIPQREAAVLAIAALGLTAWMWWGVFDVQVRASLIERQNKLDHTLASGTDATLRAEKAQLDLEVGGVRRFVNTRRLWTPCLNEISTRVPATASLEGITGQEELTTGLSRQDKNAKRQLVVDFVTNYPADSSVPPEANDALRLLRSSPVISKSYPVTELASMRLDRTKASKDAIEKAKFSVMCRPRGASIG